MNLVLLEPHEAAAPLPRADPRARHILDVLRRKEGESFDAGLVNGPIGKATLVHVAADALTLAFTPVLEPPPLPPITLLVGLPRPQTARDVLRDVTTLGVTALHFVATERSDPNYATSSLWTSGEWRRHVLAGAAQAFDTRLPTVTWTSTLASALALVAPVATESAGAVGACVALDNYEAAGPLGDWRGERDAEGLLQPVTLLLGPERGWGPADRALLRAHGATLLHLGPRVLRVETAAVAALAIVQARA